MPIGICPSCRNAPLETVIENKHSHLSCRVCGGGAFTVAVLCSLIPSRHALGLVEKAKASVPGKRGCPGCARSMVIVVQATRAGSCELDVCVACLIVWFDRGELEQDAPVAVPPSLEQMKLEQEQDHENLLRRRRAERLIQQGDGLGLLAGIVELFIDKP